MTLKNLSSFNSKIMKAAPSGELFRDMAAVVISMVANDTHTHTARPHMSADRQKQQQTVDSPKSTRI